MHPNKHPALPDTEAAQTAAQTDSALDELLDKTLTPPPPSRKADGIAIGILVGRDGDQLLVDIPDFGLTQVVARSLASADESRFGEAVALGFEAADPHKPIILGFMLAQPVAAVVDGESLLIEAEHEIELRCGEAAILLTADGHISLRGKYITSHAHATQRILGGSVQIN